MSTLCNGVPQLANLADTLPYFAPQPSRAARGDIDCFGRTDIGRVRERNEDQFVIARLARHTELECTSIPADACLRMWAGTEARLLAVADGMGGHAGGDLAGTIVLQAMLEHVIQRVPWPGDERASMDDVVLRELARGLDTCQERLAALAESRGTERRKPGTTLTLAYMVWPTLYLMHVGDSRCYLYRRPRLVRLTSDDTLAQLLVEKDGMAPDRAARSPLARVLLQAVDAGGQRIDPELLRVPLCAGDTLLLCSDGLTAELSEQEIARELGADTPARECTQRLIDAANRAGSRDNVTAVVARL